MDCLFTPNVLVILLSLAITSIVNLREDEYISTLSVGGSILEIAPVIT